MLLGGLWHGAAWTFVIWGAIHGCFLAAHKWWRSRRPLVEEPSRAAALLCTIATFHVVCGAWIFFRSPDLRTALRYCEGLLTLRPGPVDVEALAVLIPAALATLFIDIAQRRARQHEVVVRWPAVVRGSIYATFGLAIVVFSGGAPVPFIYFQF